MGKRKSLANKPQPPAHYARILDIILSHLEDETDLEDVHCMAKEIVEYIEWLNEK